MRWVHPVNISQRSMSSVDGQTCWDLVVGHEDCQVANSRSTGLRQQNTDDRNSSDDNAERSTSTDRRRLVWSCSPGTGEPFHEETDTSARRAWIVLGKWRRASRKRHAVAATSRYRTSECCWWRRYPIIQASEFITRSRCNCYVPRATQPLLQLQQSTGDCRKCTREKLEKSYHVAVNYTDLT